MGNHSAKIGHCFSGAGDTSLRRDTAVSGGGFGHSFFYATKNDTNNATTTRFRTISGASVSANNSTPLSTDMSSSLTSDRADAFESSTLFTSAPLQPVPRSSGSGAGAQVTGVAERGFLSGPISSDCSEPKTVNPKKEKKKRSSLTKIFQRVVMEIIATNSGGKKATVSVSPVVKPSVDIIDTRFDSNDDYDNDNDNDVCNCVVADNVVVDDESLQWAQGKAGEDRVHVVISEDRGWVFVGIYDGFNGPDAPDYLISHLYAAVSSELSPELRPGEEVLAALAAALRGTEEGYLAAADRNVEVNPELALMGSCVLVMMMKGRDVYLMNVGDSRAVLGFVMNDLDTIAEEGPDGVSEVRKFVPSDLSSVQLTMDHSTYVAEEVERIRKEHPDDECAVTNERVKGYLKVTRAFGAGFLKQPKWNNALLEMFRIKYIGTKPYLTCEPSLYHHKLRPSDKFLILSSDGLYQYFTNQQAVSEVDLFISSFPDGDPAQHLVEEVLFRAAKKAGMDFHELLDIPHGERRRYHDDISIIVISLEGRIWRSSM